MLARIQQTNAAWPHPNGAYCYYTRHEAARQYALHCRRPRTPGDDECTQHVGAEEILLDGNALAEGHAYSALGVVETSPNAQWLLYSHDVLGDEAFTLFARSLATREDIRIANNTYYSAAWTNDGTAVYYMTLDSSHRPHVVWRYECAPSTCNSHSDGLDSPPLRVCLCL